MKERVASEIEHLAHAEQQAVERHRAYLEEIRGGAVSSEAALADWHANYAQKWRQACLARMLERQREEINRHKWIESEKAQCDVGREAVLDWVQRYASRWRKWYDENETPALIDDIYS